jgi:4-diphosphocytidyl-2-C-methyl-D-erythritol kinase
LSIHLLAPAKINLGLEVIGRRSDGYHDLCTVMGSISLFDKLSMGVWSESSLMTTSNEIAPADNLVAKASQLFQRLDPKLRATIILHKRIPFASGLGGASSDAAATLIGLRTLSAQSITMNQIEALGGELGSDVPFFVRGGAALVEGRGERITPLTHMPDASVVVVTPRIAIPNKTATLYRSLDPSDFSDGSIVRELVENPIGIAAAGAPPNAFARALYRIAPELAEIPVIMRHSGLQYVALSGAGPSHYAIEPDRVRARRVAIALRSRLGGNAAVFVTRFVKAGILIEDDHQLVI